MGKHEELLAMVYRAFNAREIDTVLAAMHPDVDWPNGWEGGRVYGHSAVREYWLRQWEVLDPQVEPQGFTTDEIGRMIVDVHAVVRDQESNVLADQMIRHIYTIVDGLITCMEIQKS
jgi:hypothetical protein